MGTRAAFFDCDPIKTANLVEHWLGCIAWDGHPENFLDDLCRATTKKEFITEVKNAISDRDDYTDPSKHGWPFPWADNIFITDYCYWWDDG